MLVLPLILLVHELAHGTLDSLGDLVHVLWLDQRLQVILQDLGEVVLQLGAAEVRQDLRPVRRILDEAYFKH